MTAETVGYLIGFGLGLWAWYRIGRYAYRRIRG